MIFHHTRILTIWDLAFRLKFSALIYLILRTMADLVMLRELLRNEQARGHSDDIDRIFDRANFSSLFESALVRAAIPCSPGATALLLPFGSKGGARKIIRRRNARYPAVHDATPQTSPRANNADALSRLLQRTRTCPFSGLTRFPSDSRT